MNLPDGGPAFPQPHYETSDDEGNPTTLWTGMSLRDWFAGLALAGIKLHAKSDFVTGVELDDAARQVAIGAYAVADAMLKKREAQP